MRKIILWLALLLPTFANAQWVNGVIQRDNTSTWIRYMQGANQVRLALYSDLPSGTNFIENQSASAQTANSWITGSHIIGTNPSAFGAIRLPNNTGIFWRNAANTNNIGLTLSSSDVLTTSANIAVGSVTSSTVGSNVMVKANGSGTLVSAVSNTDYLPVNSPAMTGTPTAPTATGGTNTTQIATTAFVQSAVSGISGFMDLTTNQTVATGIKAFTPNIVVQGMYLGTKGLTQNTILGNSAGSSIVAPGTANTLIGDGAASNSTSGSQNLLIGVNVAPNLTTGGSNTFIGNSTGGGITTGSNNTIIGKSVGSLASGLSNNVILSDGAGNIRAQHNGTSWTLGTINSPTLVTPVLGAATGTSLNLSGGLTVNGTGIPTMLQSTNNDYVLNLRNASSSNAYLGTNSNNLILAPNSGSTALTVKNSGVIQFNTGYTAGTINSDASGNLSSVSSRLVKERFKPFTRGLEAIRGLSPEKWHYRKSSGMDTKNEYTSLIAENVKEFIPEAVFNVAEGQNLAVQDRPIIATMVNAIKELDQRTTYMAIAIFALLAWCLRLELKTRKLLKNK